MAARTDDGSNKGEGELGRTRRTPTTRTIYIRGIAPFANEQRRIVNAPSTALLTKHENLDAHDLQARTRERDPCRILGAAACYSHRGFSVTHRAAHSRDENEKV